MRTLLFLLQKEFKQIFRNKVLLGMIFGMPVIQLLILPWAADYEIKNIAIAIVDHDHSDYSQRLISKITASEYFHLNVYAGSFQEAIRYIERDRADLVLEIPPDFERGLITESPQKVFVAVNAINGVKANLGGAYLNRILRDFNDDVRLQWGQPERFQPAPAIQVTSSDWFNPAMNYRHYMVPGILAFLTTLISAYLCALNAIREKETGTMEQLNVTPVGKYHFILGKLIPFWIVGIIIFSFGLFIIARFVYGIVPIGNVWALFTYLAVYLVAMLGFGLLISTYCDTQQQVMFVMFFFMMIFILMSGLFTPVESMPVWAYAIAKCSPVTYLMDVIRMIILKGSGFADIRNHFMMMIGFSVLFNVWAVVNYKKTTG
ncbi:ABC transporter permease [Limibacterium fermenti]|uniref:ABC transporter permease n=1 Tax=Limibacterium fermenti TaxID=3229863 RepID=UPI000E941015|nr:ABC transporter permease [Porphyromonadaceae bacterium]